jgi:DNA-binding NtrC family response regulator
MPSAPHETVEESLQRPASTGATRHTPQLILALECARPRAGSARWSLADADEIVLGRGEARGAIRSLAGRSRTLAITVPDARMSGRHGVLRPHGAGFVFEDAGARNGSFVNGARVERAVLADGDVLQLGRTLFLFRAALPTPAGALDDVDARDLAALPAALRTVLPALADGFSRLARVARDGGNRLPVLLLGETGSGKELVARAIHALHGPEAPRARPEPRGPQAGAASPRDARPFVGVNCGAIPAALVEGQLFGHVRGAFSGAVRDAQGFVRAADGGTLFLDEIGDLPKPAQATLLRVLQEREVVPLGTARAIPVDLRVIAATHLPLEQRVESGEFRADLLSRIAGFTFHLPPLRERREDLGILVAELLGRAFAERADAVRFSPEAGRALLVYEYPHNVRELERCLSLAVTLAGAEEVDLRHLPEAIAASLKAPGRPHDEARANEDAELRSRLLAALEAHGGNITEVAKEFGKARPQIHRWMTRFHIDPDVYRRGR